MLLGDTAGALNFVDRVAANWQPYNNVWSPEFDPIRNHPRFQAALARMGLPYLGESRP